MTEREHLGDVLPTKEMLKGERDSAFEEVNAEFRRRLAPYEANLATPSAIFASAALLREWGKELEWIEEHGRRRKRMRLTNIEE